VLVAVAVVVAVAVRGVTRARGALAGVEVEELLPLLRLGVGEVPVREEL